MFRSKTVTQRSAQSADQGFLCAHRQRLELGTRGLREARGLSGVVPVVANDQFMGVEQPLGILGGSARFGRLATQLATRRVLCLRGEGLLRTSFERLSFRRLITTSTMTTTRTTSARGPIITVTGYDAGNRRFLASISDQ
jgi:hypothetical protein